MFLHTIRYPRQRGAILFPQPCDVSSGTLGGVNTALVCFLGALVATKAFRFRAGDHNGKPPVEPSVTVMFNWTLLPVGTISVGFCRFVWRFLGFDSDVFDDLQCEWNSHLSSFDDQLTPFFKPADLRFGQLSAAHGILLSESPWHLVQSGCRSHSWAHVSLRCLKKWKLSVDSSTHSLFLRKKYSYRVQMDWGSTPHNTDFCPRKHYIFRLWIINHWAHLKLHAEMIQNSFIS